MEGSKLSEELDAVLPADARYMDMLLETVSGSGGVVSDIGLQRVCTFLGDVCRSQVLNHELLQRVLKCLQTWSLSQAVLHRLLQFGIVQILSQIYDYLLQRDYSRTEVFTSILDLLFVVEDMSESNEGKTQCGKYFLSRLLALATAKVPSVKLQRAVVETICALVTKSPDNQRAVLVHKADWFEILIPSRLKRIMLSKFTNYKLFKVFLPECGDFQSQASITEIFYRLLKRDAQLLDILEDKMVKRSIESLVHCKKPDLLLEIRRIVMLLNESLGQSRSVYSFLAEEIVVNGKKIVIAEKWVNFGKSQLTLNTDNELDGPSVLDVQYDDIKELKINLELDAETATSKCSVQIGCRMLYYSFADYCGGKTGTPCSIADFSAVEACVLPNIRRRNGVLKESNAHSCDKTLSIAINRRSHGGLGFNKSSMGISIPLPRSITSTSGPTQASNCFLKPTIAPPARSIRTDIPGEDVDGGKEILPGNNHLPKFTGGACRKQNLDDLQFAPEFVSETPQDIPEAASNAMAPEKGFPEGGLDGSHAKPDVQFESNDEARVPDNLRSLETNAGKICKFSEGAGPKRFNPGIALETPRPIWPEEANPVDLDKAIDTCNKYKFRSSTPGIGCTPEVWTQLKHFHEVTNSAKDDIDYKDKEISEKTHVQTETLKIQSSDPGPGVDCEAETAFRELRTKKRLDRSGASLRNDSLMASPEIARNGGSRLTNVYSEAREEILEEVRQSADHESSEKIQMTPPTNMQHDRKNPGNGSVVQNISSNAEVMEDCATAQLDNVSKKVPRTFRDRECKKPTNYFVPDESVSESASERSGYKKLKSAVSDPIETDSCKRRSTPKVVRSCKGKDAKWDKGALRSTASRKNNAELDQPRRQKSAPMFVSRRHKCFGKKQAAHERKVMDDVEDVFRFTTERGHDLLETALELSCKTRRNYTYRKRKMKPVADSRNLPSIRNLWKQSATSDGQGPVQIPVVSSTRTRSPEFSPGSGSPFTDSHASPGFLRVKQQDVLPEQDCNRNKGSLSSDSDFSLSLQAEKPYSGPARMARSSRVNRWKSFTVRKLRVSLEDGEGKNEQSDKSHERIIDKQCEGEEDTALVGQRNKGIDLIASLLECFKQKVKSQETRKVTGFLSDTLHLVQHEFQSAEERVEGDKTELMALSKRKYEKLDSNLREQTKKLQVIYENFKEDFAEHLHGYETIVTEIGETEKELNNLAKRQGQEHEQLLTQLQEVCRSHLVSADQKIRLVRKGSKSLYGLKIAIKGIMANM